MIAIFSGLDMVQSLGVLPMFAMFAPWGTIVMVLVLAYIVGRQGYQLYLDARSNAQQLERLNTELRSTIEKMHEANDKLALSEEKYRFLVDYSKDFVFMLAEDATLLNANVAMQKEFRLKAAAFGTVHFFDFI